jgi:hypothetical protein
MDTFTHIVAVLAAALVPLVLLRIGLLIYARVAPSDADAVPLLHVAGIGIGALLGVGLLAAMPHGADFEPSLVLSADGPWAVGLGGMVARHALPDAATFDLALESLRTGYPGAAAWPLRVGVVLMLALMVHAALLWRGFKSVRAAVAVLLLACWIALLTYLVAHLLAWAVAQANFWAFAIALLLWQRWRYAGPRAAH